jgi:hypothetical protein
MKERLMEFLKYLKIGQNKFAESVGLSRGYVNNIGDNMTLKTVNKILQVYPMLNGDWLLTGEGEMLVENPLETPQTESCKKEEKNQSLPHTFEHGFSEIIAIGKANVEINKMNAESFGKVADSHVTLVENQSVLVKSNDTLANSTNILASSTNTLANTNDTLANSINTLAKSNEKLADIIQNAKEK